VEKIVVATEFAGPTYQYSHGLSVYFPWSERASDRQLLHDYTKYKFNDTGWLSFLKSYFEKTRRASQKTESLEAAHSMGVAVHAEDEEQQLAEDLVSLVFNGEGLLSGETSLADAGKVSPTDRTGNECSCQTIKNYPLDTRARRLREQSAPSAGGSDTFVPVSKGLSFLRTFEK
jgi:hypothetical protein